MYTINDFFKIPLQLLGATGISAKTGRIDEISIALRPFFYINMVNLVASVFGEMIFFVKNIANSTSDFIQMTFLTLCIGFIWIGIVKISVLIKKVETLNRLINGISEHFPRDVDAQYEYQVASYTKKAKLMMITYATVQIFMIWCFNLLPLSETIYTYWRDDVWALDFSYTVWYPVLDPYRRGIFEILYVSQYWAAHISAMYILSADILLCSIGEQICMHFDQLSRRLATMQIDKIDASEEKQLLKDCVEKHNVVIR